MSRDASRDISYTYNSWNFVAKHVALNLYSVSLTKTIMGGTSGLDLTSAIGFSLPEDVEVAPSL